MKNKFDNLKIDNVVFWSEHEENKGGMRIYWSGDAGFGTLDIVKHSGNDGEDFESPEEELMLVAYTERMGKEFTRKILNMLADKLIF